MIGRESVIFAANGDVVTAEFPDKESMEAVSQILREARIMHRSVGPDEEKKACIDVTNKDILALKLLGFTLNLKSKSEAVANLVEMKVTKVGSDLIGGGTHQVVETILVPESEFVTEKVHTILPDQVGGGFSSVPTGAERLVRRAPATIIPAGLSLESGDKAPDLTKNLPGRKYSGRVISDLFVEAIGTIINFATYDREINDMDGHVHHDAKGRKPKLPTVLSEALYAGLGYEKPNCSLDELLDLSILSPTASLSEANRLAEQELQLKPDFISVVNGGEQAIVCSFSGYNEALLKISPVAITHKSPFATIPIHEARIVTEGSGFAKLSVVPKFKDLPPDYDHQAGYAQLRPYMEASGFKIVPDQETRRNLKLIQINDPNSLIRGSKILVPILVDKSAMQACEPGPKPDDYDKMERAYRSAQYDLGADRGKQFYDANILTAVKRKAEAKVETVAGGLIAV